MSKGMYVGVNSVIPGEQKNYNAENFDDFFTTEVKYSTTGASVPVPTDSDGIVLIDFPSGSRESFQIWYTTKCNINNFTIAWSYNLGAESQVMVRKNNVDILPLVTGGSGNSYWEGTLLKDDVLEVTHMNNDVNDTFAVITQTDSTISEEGYIAEVARKVTNMYVGVETSVPIKEITTTTETIPLSTTNLSHFFSTSTGSGSSGWQLATLEDSNQTSLGLMLIPGNIGISSSTATITLTALNNLTNVQIYGQYYTESGYDKITLTVKGSSILNEASGNQPETTFWAGSLSTGQQIVLKYVKDSSVNNTNESSTYFIIDCNDLIITTTTEEIVGYETKEVARKIKKGYVGIGEIAKQFWPSISTPYSYTGIFSEQTGTIGSTPYTVVTLTSTGTLTLNKDNVMYWLVSGGNSGVSGLIVEESGIVWAGGGGGGGMQNSGTLNKGTYAVTIGAGGSNGNKGGSTSIGSNTTPAASHVNDGGSGGGGASRFYNNSYTATWGAGEGISTIPFSGYVTNSFSLLQTSLCAGGGGGQLCNYESSGNYLKVLAGSSGGSNGSSSSQSSLTHDNTLIDVPSSGGFVGGGAGGTYLNANGSAATYYGGGGGGGSAALGSSYSKSGTGGAGYPGIAILLIPKTA